MQMQVPIVDTIQKVRYPMVVTGTQDNGTIEIDSIRSGTFMRDIINTTLQKNDINDNEEICYRCGGKGHWSHPTVKTNI